MATQHNFTNTTVFVLTKTGLAYNGSTTTKYNTHQQWVLGCLLGFGKNPQVGSTCTYAQMHAAYLKGNPNNTGNANANICYHATSARITVQAPAK